MDGPTPHWRSPASRLRLALSAVVAASVAMMAHFTARSTFVWDDIVNFREAQVSGLSLGYLLDASPAACCLGLRFVPAHRFGYWLLQELAPMNFRVAQALALVCFALVLVVLHRLLVELFGPGPGPVVITLLYATSTVHVDVIQWWAASLDRLPGTLFSLLCMLGYLYFHRTGSGRWLVLSLLALSVALLFHTKAVLVPLYLVLLHPLILSEEPLRDDLRAVVRQWRIWMAYLVPVGLYLAVYLNRYVEEGLADPSLARLGRYLPILWFRIVGPALFGIYIPENSGQAVAAPIMVGTQVALLGAVLWTIGRRRTAWRAWAFFLVAFLVNAMLVGLTRIAVDTGKFGPNGLAYVLRYNAEIAYLGAIALGSVLLGGMRSSMSRPGGERFRGRAPVLVGIGVALSVCFAWVGAGRVGAKSVWVGARVLPYVENVQEGLRALHRSGRQVALVDGVTPYDFVPSFQAPYNSHSEAMRVIDERVSFDATGRELYAVAPDGAVLPVAFSAEAGGDAEALLIAGALGVSPGTPTFDERGLCVRAGADGAVIGFTPMRPSSGAPIHLLLRYDSSSGGLLKLVTEPIGGGQPSGRLVTMPGGRVQTTVFDLDALELQRIYLALAAESEICVQRLDVGRLGPR